MRLVLISDTHLAQPDLPSGDILCHAGDLTFRGRKEEVAEQIAWLKHQKRKHGYRAVFVVPGNNELGFEASFAEEKQKFEIAGLTLLNDDSALIDGVKFWGSPVQPWFMDMEFNRERGADIRQHWDLIPGDTDVLITHGPPYGILDKCRDGRVVGCADLLEIVRQIKPKVHVFGHIHESYGQMTIGATKFINASIMNEFYIAVNAPVVIDL